MRSSTIVALAVAVASTPAMAAPAPIQPVQDESGALSFKDVKDFGKGFVKGFTGTLSAATPVIQAAADVAGAVGAHKAREVDESGALKWKDVGNGITNAINTVAPAVSAVSNLASSLTPLLSHKQGRELVARAILEVREDLDESAALSLKGILKGAGKVVSTVAPIAGAVAPFVIREEDVQLVARDLENLDESAALSLKGILKGAGKVAKTAGKVVSTVAPIAGAVAPFVIREEDGVLVARETEEDESGALFLKAGIKAAIKAAPHIANLFNREDVEEDESGALSFKSILKGAGKVAKTVGPLLIREEDGQLVAREVETDESGALFLKAAIKAATKAAPIVAGLFNREEIMARDFDDYLMAREDFDESGALSAKGVLRTAGKVAKTAGRVASKFIREDESDESGALSLKGVLRGAGKVAKTVGPLLIREEELMARDYADYLVAREFEDEDSGAIALPGAHRLIDGVGHPLGSILHREDDAEFDESGALSLKGVLRTAGKVAKTVAPYVIRDFDDEDSGAMVLPGVHWHDGKLHPAREDDADFDESGALSFKSILKGAGKVAKTVGPLLIREEDLEDESGALSFKGVLRGAGKVAKTVGPLLIREEDADFDESGALSLKGVLRTAGKVAKTVAPYVIREEDAFVARSLNELD